MSNAIFVTENLIPAPNVASAVTLSTPGSTTESGLGIDNVRTRQLNEVVRFTSGTNQQIKVDFGLAQNFDTIALLGHNLQPVSGTWRIETSDDDFSTVKTDTGFQDAVRSNADSNQIDQPILLHRFSPGEFSQYIRITLDDTTDIEVGRLIVEEAYELPINPQYGATVSYIDPTERRFARGGTPYFNIQEKRRLLTFETVTVGSTADQDMFTDQLDIERRLGKSGDVLFSLEPDSDNTLFYYRTLYGVLRDTNPVDLVTFGKRVKQWQIEEVK